MTLMHTEFMNYISRMLDITHDEKGALNKYTHLKLFHVTGPSWELNEHDSGRLFALHLLLH
jgi:hypothetical protein